MRSANTGMKEWASFLREQLAFEGWRFDLMHGYGREEVKECVAGTTGRTALSIAKYYVDLRCNP